MNQLNNERGARMRQCGDCSSGERQLVLVGSTEPSDSSSDAANNSPTRSEATRDRRGENIEHRTGQGCMIRRDALVQLTHRTCGPS